MEPRLGLYDGVLAAVVLVTGALAVYAWRRRETRDAALLAVVLVGETGWAATALASASLPETWIALAAARGSYLFIPAVVTGIFLFALSYTGREEWLGPRLYAALAVEPVLLVAAVWTNDAYALGPGHNLFWREVALTGAGESGWLLTHGPLFWVHAGYSYLLMLAATVWLVRFALRTEWLYRQQVFAIVLGVSAPWFGNALFLSDTVAVDPTPVAFAITGAGLVWAIRRTRLLDIVPIARDAVLDDISEAMLVVDTDGSVVDGNPAACELFGESSMVGETVPALLDGRPQVLERYREFQGTTAERSVELEVGDRYYSVTVSPVTDARSELLGQVFLIHDVTERRQRQHALERRNEQLDQFAAVVSHDLRNPLQVASGALELARETGEAAHFERVAQAHDRMAWLIDDLLTLARRGDVLADVTDTTLETVARDAWRTVDTEGATLRVDGDRPLRADPDRLQQLFENLYRNSIEHGAEGGRARNDAAAENGVTLTVEPTDDGFAVTDDGPGIPESVRERLNADGTGDAENGGIGLTIVSYIVEAHGWTLSAENDGGARFDIAGVDGTG
jgi:PAS domain S-box-containing protein